MKNSIIYMGMLIGGLFLLSRKTATAADTASVVSSSTTTQTIYDVNVATPITQTTSGKQSTQQRVSGVVDVQRQVAYMQALGWKLISTEPYFISDQARFYNAASYYLLNFEK
jgi:hypothetical protein